MKRNILKLIKENNEAGLLANIHQQTDVKFVDEAASIIGELRKIFEDSKTIKNSEDLMIQHPNGSKLVKKLEDAFTERFIVKSKAKFKILADMSKNAFAYPIMPNTSRSILAKNETTVEENINAALAELENYGSGEAKKDTIDISSIAGIKNLLNSVLKSSKQIEEQMKVGIVEFDLKNAVMINLPDDFNFIMGIDLFYFLKDSKLNDREILSVLIHEAGHCYTVLMDVYRTADTNVILNDLMSNLDKNSPDKVLLTLSKEFNLPTPSLKEKDNNKEVLFVVSSVFEEIAKGRRGNVKNSAAAERFADQFPVRFDLGPEFFNAIKFFNSLSSYSEVDHKLMMPIADWFLKIMMVASLIVILLGSLVTAGAVAMVATYTQIAAGFRMLLLMIRFMVGTDDANANIYDDSKRRLESIRNDFVRRLNGMIPKDKEEREMLKIKFLELEDMDNSISKLRKNRSTVGLFGELLMPWLRKKSKETMINELLENMEANKLQVLSEKIKLSGGL